MVQACVAYQNCLNIRDRLVKRAESLRTNSVSQTTLKTLKKQWACYKKIAKNSFGKNIPATPPKRVNIWPIV